MHDRRPSREVGATGSGGPPRPYRWVAALALVLAGILATACGSDATTSGGTTASSARAAVPAGARDAVVVANGGAAALQVRFSGGGGSGVPEGDVRVAMIGVAPPGPGACFAAESDSFAAQALPVGASVRLVADVQETAPDGALLRYVWDSDGELYNADVLRQGFAKAAPTSPNDRFGVELLAAEVEAKGAGRGVWACPAEAPTTRGTAPGTTRATRPSASVPAPTEAPPATKVPDPVPGGRNAGLGQSFSISVGETVGITGEGLTVTYVQLVQDSRCPAGVQCIVAGDATIALTVAKAGSPSASLSLNSDAPRSGKYLNYTVELVELAQYSSRATLTVT